MSAHTEIRTNMRLVVILLGVLTAIGPLTIDTYLPAFTAIAADLHTDVATVSLSMSSYFIGIAVGQLIYGPLLDVFGRKGPLVYGLVLYILASLGCALSYNVEWLIGLRLVLALGGCAGMVAARAVVRDLFPLHETARVFSSLMLVMGLAPIVAPTLGGLIVASLGWRYIFFLMGGSAVVMLAGVWWILPAIPGHGRREALHPRSALRDYLAVLAVPGFTLRMVTGSFYIAGLFIYLTASPLIFMDMFGMSGPHYGWTMGGNALALVIGSQVNARLLKRFSLGGVLWRSNLLLLAVSALFVLGAILVPVPLWMVLVFAALYLFCLGFLLPDVTALIMEPFGREQAGSASALLGAVQMMAGALAAALVSWGYDGTVAVMAIGMPVCALGSVGLLWRERYPVRVQD
ncbi:membrane protein, major facilitator superfamily [Syntrophotalea carbinolica DSM 2380]|uniref:Membrane protein, major facilitator superfamily n=1 Tax=Syntrophotalea carbinolica (strain DSM 2380 / NBRC 103641 / GraBd1) TaxID=338963 RepID=Q3A194_SYNC1|nr:multidrug effflux MFS transporter [Syntrophotalea carbinolica]ABA89863.1 membrane protein, major facilitator superfamily [Syntrophotalea carbinolica DSM 2380]